MYVETRVELSHGRYQVHCNTNLLCKSCMVEATLSGRCSLHNHFCLNWGYLAGASLAKICKTPVVANTVSPPARLAVPRTTYIRLRCATDPVVSPKQPSFLTCQDYILQEEAVVLK